MTTHSIPEPAPRSSAIGCSATLTIVWSRVTIVVAAMTTLIGHHGLAGRPADAAVPVVSVVLIAGSVFDHGRSECGVILRSLFRGPPASRSTGSRLPNSRGLGSRASGRAPCASLPRCMLRSVLGVARSGGCADGGWHGRRASAATAPSLRDVSHSTWIPCEAGADGAARVLLA